MMKLNTINQLFGIIHTTSYYLVKLSSYSFNSQADMNSKQESTKAKELENGQNIKGETRQSKIKEAGSPKHQNAFQKTPSNISNKLNHWKSEKALKTESDLSTQDPKTKDEFKKKNLQSPESQSMNSIIKNKSEINAKSTIKPNSPKIQNYFPAKGVEKKNQKTTVCQNCESLKEKFEQSQKKIKELEEKIQKLGIEKEQSVTALQKEKNENLKKMEQYELIKSENKKLMKFKADSFNQKGGQMQLREKVNELEEKIRNMEKGSKFQNESKSQFLQLESSLPQEENPMEHIDSMASSQASEFPYNQEMKMLKNTRECTIEAEQKSETPEFGKENSIKIESLEQSLLEKESEIKNLEDEKMLILGQKSSKQKEYLEEIDSLKKLNSQLISEREEQTKKLKESSILQNGGSSCFADFKKSRASYQQKIDRIKAISEHQFEIIQQMKESSKIVLSEIESSASSIQ